MERQEGKETEDGHECWREGHPLLQCGSWEMLLTGLTFEVEPKCVLGDEREGQRGKEEGPAGAARTQGS